MKFVGERVVPGDMSGFFPTYQEHLVRYMFAVEYVAGKRVADMACGTGYGLQMMAGVAEGIWGYDVDAEAVELALALSFHGLYPNIHRLDLEADPLPEQRFDVITSFETIEHLANPDRFVSWCREHCDTLVFSIPNDLPNPPFHKIDYTFEDARRLMEPHFAIEWFGQSDRIHLSRDDVEHAEYFIGVGKPLTAAEERLSEALPE